MANAGWCLLACLAVVGINAARIGSMALNGNSLTSSTGR